MDINIFGEILDNLKDINYFFISGMSVAIHSCGKRMLGDLDIAVHENDIELFYEIGEDKGNLLQVLPLAQKLFVLS